MKNRYPTVLPILKRITADHSACDELKFHPTRKWRFDFALPLYRVAIEIDGGVWSGGRHTRGSGFIKDAEKMNAAAILGWRILRFTPQDIKGSEWMQTVREACKC